MHTSAHKQTHSLTYKHTQTHTHIYTHKTKKITCTNEKTDKRPEQYIKLDNKDTQEHSNILIKTYK